MQHKLVGLEPNRFNQQNKIEEVSMQDVAIIGIALRMPGADRLETMWEDLLQGKCHISSFPSARERDVDNLLDDSAIPKEQRKYGLASYLDRVDLFDHDFFSIAPTEATMMDPHQRIFYEVAHEAIEDAGYGGKRLYGSATGVYLAFNSKKGRNYEDLIAYAGYDEDELTFSGNIPTIAAGRIAYQFDLSGPNMLVDTACSSSLVAVHAACQALRAGECDMAIAGGITLNLAPFDIFRKQGIESDDGMTRAFDDSSTGTGTGEGVIAIFLKPLYQAVADRNHIYCTIKGSFVNHDGHSNGLTAPNPRAQGKLLEQAWRNARVSPDSIGYIEAHGTGTALGDPIEIQAIKEAFERHTSKKQFCGVGSLKTNYGHLDVTAGLAGLVKAVLALRNKVIPPSLFFEFPNRNIDFIDAPVFVCDKALPWQTEDGAPRRAGVSSFGISGTNCHVVLEEYPGEGSSKAEQNGYTHGAQVFALSANSASALGNLVTRYLDDWETLSTLRLEDICFTANVGRAHHSIRLAIIADRLEELYSSLLSIDQNGLEEDRSRRIYVRKRNKPSLHSVQEQYRLPVHDLLKAIGETGAGVDNYEKLCVYYCQGASIDWSRLFQRSSHNTVRLPTYPYAPTRCWPKGGTQQATESNLPFYSIVWRQGHKRSAAITDPAKKALYLLRPNAPYAALGMQVATSSNGCVATIGSPFARLGENHYQLKAQVQDFQMLLEEQSCRGITKFVYFQQYGQQTSGCVEEHASGNERCPDVIALYGLVKSLASVYGRQEIELVIVTAGACNPSPQGSKEPSASALYAMGRAIGVEHPSWKVRVVDIDETTQGQIAQEEIIFGMDAKIALRGGQRYEETLVEMPDTRLEKTPLVEAGVYVLTGGCGAIGCRIAQWLTETYHARVALISRNVSERKAQPNIAQLLQGEARVQLLDADVANKEQLSAALDAVRKQLGPINGVFHLAGVADAHRIEDCPMQVLREVLAPKITGTVLIDDLTRQDSLDFMVLFSSAATVFPMPGMAAYSAANAYLSAYSTWRAAQIGRTMALEFAGWDIGIGATDGTQTPSGQGLIEQISSEQGIAALEEALLRGATQVIIGKLNAQAISQVDARHQWKSLGIRIDQTVLDNLARSQESSIALDLASVELSGRSDEGYTAAERLVSLVWCRLLGYQAINIDEDFFELGGHSLLVLKLEADLSELGISIHGEDVYEHNTARKFALLIQEKGEQNDE